MAWRQAVTIAVWQLGATLAMGVLAAAAAYFLDLKVPGAISAVALMVGAQSYALTIEQKQPGAIVGRIGALAWRAALLSTAIGLVLAGGYLALAAPYVPEFSEFIGKLRDAPALAALLVAVVAVLTLGSTALGLRMGVQVAGRAAAAKARAAARAKPNVAPP